MIFIVNVYLKQRGKHSCPGIVMYYMSNKQEYLGGHRSVGLHTNESVFILGLSVARSNDSHTKHVVLTTPHMRC